MNYDLTWPLYIHNIITRWIYDIVGRGWARACAEHSAVNDRHQNMIIEQPLAPEYEREYTRHRIYMKQNVQATEYEATLQAYAQHNWIGVLIWLPQVVDPSSIVHEQGQQQCCLQPTSRLPGRTITRRSRCNAALPPSTLSHTATGPPRCAVWHDHGYSVFTVCLYLSASAGYNAVPSFPLIQTPSALCHTLSPLS